MTSPGPRVETLPVVDSTNAEGMRRIAAGERGPLWLRAVRQTGGKGRSGRSWASEPGNLYASLITRLDVPLAAVAQLSLVTGVAMIDAIDAVVGARLPELRLKWPNDVLIGGAKTAGILPESTLIGNQVVAVVGIGMNLSHHPFDLGRAATHLGAHAAAVSPERMLDALDTALAPWLGVWQSEDGFSAVRDAWGARAGAVGERLSVNELSGPRTGTFAGLDADGALMMRANDGSLLRITYGDVTLGKAGKQG